MTYFNYFNDRTLTPEVQLAYGAEIAAPFLEDPVKTIRMFEHEVTPAGLSALEYLRTTVRGYLDKKPNEYFDMGMVVGGVFVKRAFGIGALVDTGCIKFEPSTPKGSKKSEQIYSHLCSAAARWYDDNPTMGSVVVQMADKIAAHDSRELKTFVIGAGAIPALSATALLYMPLAARFPLGGMKMSDN